MMSVLALFLGLGIIFGAPYLPTHRRDAETALDAVELKPGELFVDIGCGDGVLLRAAAARGATAIGYEINPLVWLTARIACWKQRQNISVRLGNFWRHDLSDADVIFAFLTRPYMKRLEEKLARQAKPGARVLSYGFELPKRPVDANAGGAHLYRY